MDGDEPEMGERSFENRIDVAGIAVKPVEKSLHLCIQSRCCWSFEVNSLATDGTGDDLHGTGRIIAPCSGGDLRHAAAPCWKERRMPCEQPVGSKGLLVVARRIEHHFDHAFDVSVGGLESTDVHAKAAGERGSNLLGIEFLTLNFAGLENV